MDTKLIKALGLEFVDKSEFLKHRMVHQRTKTLRSVSKEHKEQMKEALKPQKLKGADLWIAEAQWILDNLVAKKLKNQKENLTRTYWMVGMLISRNHRIRVSLWIRSKIS